jgi:predicted transcriptional regulator
MIQSVLPIFPPGSNCINNHVGFEEKEGRVYYFHGQFPIYFHEKMDLISFRYITAQLVVSGNVKQAEVIKAFGVPAISVKRSVKLLREEGIEGFTKKRTGGTPHVLTSEVAEKVQRDLYKGLSPGKIGKKYNLKQSTIQKAINSGRLKKKV